MPPESRNVNQRADLSAGRARRTASGYRGSACATYHRTRGICYFHGCYSVGDDQLWGVTGERKGADHTLAALKSIRAARPGGYRLFIICEYVARNIFALGLRRRGRPRYVAWLALVWTTRTLPPFGVSILVPAVQLMPRLKD